jgi:hypothetical protein
MINSYFFLFSTIIIGFCLKQNASKKQYIFFYKNKKEMHNLEN